MNKTPLSETHHDTEIVYDEKDNKWKFTLRGRERSADSLAQAREIIDKPVKDKKASTFERVECYHWEYGNRWEIVTATSLADNNYVVEFWIVDKAKNRSKVWATSLYPVNERNTALITTIKALDVQIKALKTQRGEVIQRLHTLKPPKEIE